MVDRFSQDHNYYLIEGFYPSTRGIGPNGKFYGACKSCKIGGPKQYVSVVLAGVDAKLASESASSNAPISATQLVEKNLNIPDKDSNKDKKTVRNKRGHDEEIVDGQRTLNELEPPQAKQPLPEGKNVRNRRLNEENSSSGVAPIGSGGEGAPGGGNKHKMGHLGGKGVAARTPTKDTVGKYATDTTDSGKEWPRKQKNTGGGWEEFQASPSGNAPEATDGITSKHGGNLTGELGQNSKQKNKGASMEEVPGTGHEMSWAKTGGESAPNSTTASESWSVDSITNLMEGGDFDIQSLFNNYAANGGYVSVGDFQSLCESYGVGVQITEGVLCNLMTANRQYAFAESTDAGGRFWYPAAHIGQQQRLAEGYGDVDEGMGADGLADGPENYDDQDEQYSDDLVPVDEDGEDGSPEDDMDNPMSNVDPGGISNLDTDDIDDQESDNAAFQGQMGAGPANMDDDGMGMGDGAMGDGDMDDFGGPGDGDADDMCGPGGCDIQSLVAQITQEVADKFTAMLSGGAGNMAVAANPASQQGTMPAQPGSEINDFADTMDDNGAIDYQETNDMDEEAMPGQDDMGLDGQDDIANGRSEMGDMDDMDDEDMDDMGGMDDPGPPGLNARPGGVNRFR